ncbi:hypothetical protein HPB49_001747 [Dermacentor silvarum]|uniref:Uncharacterized protein n=1 Tax=Dermacentor silvarum TaxID=543639 RepID=A0ACB8DT11_DERSI|nr:hypothetical protein HPB49_001747 [Dermacentor silvarum]
MTQGERMAAVSVIASQGFGHLSYPVARVGADIKVHIASKKHQASLRAADNQASLTSYVRNDSDFGVIWAECFFTAFLVEHNMPLSVSDHAAPLFRKMFPRCDEAKHWGTSTSSSFVWTNEDDGDPSGNGRERHGSFAGCA